MKKRIEKCIVTTYSNVKDIREALEGVPDNALVEIGDDGYGDKYVEAYWQVDMTPEEIRVKNEVEATIAARQIAQLEARLNSLKESL